jgi:hypothetical protein
LRDIPMPVGVFQVRTAELRAEFPPLRSFVGRTASGVSNSTRLVTFGWGDLISLGVENLWMHPLWWCDAHRHSWGCPSKTGRATTFWCTGP